MGEGEQKKKKQTKQAKRERVRFLEAEAIDLRIWSKMLEVQGSALEGIWDSHQMCPSVISFLGVPGIEFYRYLYQADLIVFEFSYPDTLLCISCPVPLSALAVP